MSDFKRSVSTIAAMEAASSGASMSSKKRRTSGGGSELCSAGERLRSSHLRDLMMTTASPASSLNSAGTVVSGVFPDRVLNCCSGIVKTTTGVAVSTTATTVVPSLDLEAKGFDTVDSTTSDFKAFRRERCLLSEFSGDSEETMVSKEGNIPAENIMPSKEEIEEFFAMAEKYEQKRFTEKYNYDIGKDMPLEGRYQWVRLN